MRQKIYSIAIGLFILLVLIMGCDRNLESSASSNMQKESSAPNYTPREEEDVVALQVIETAMNTGLYQIDERMNKMTDALKPIFSRRL